MSGIDLTALDAANQALQTSVTVAKATKDYAAAATAVLHAMNPGPPIPPTPAGPFTWDASKATVAPSSGAKMTAFASYALRADGGPFAMADVAWRDAPAGTPLVNVAQKSGNGTVKWVGVPVPAGTKHSGTNDASLAITDSAGVEYDLANCNDAITSAFGVAYAWPGSVNALLPGGLVNANAARFVSRAGLITPAEMAAGHIPHALYFVMPNVGPAPNPYPANTTTGYPANTGLPLGSWIRLDPALVLPKLPAWQHTLAVALQQYGAFLRDIGSSFHLCLTDQVNQGGNKADWTAAGVPLTGTNNGGQPYIASFDAGFPWGSLQLLLPPSP